MILVLFIVNGGTSDQRGKCLLYCDYSEDHIYGMK